MPEDNGLELYKKYRPKRFKDLIGQPKAVAQLLEMVQNKRVPHAILFTGGSGTGKTSAARILKTKLGCGDDDFFEVNAASSRGIDTIRDIQQRLSLAPMFGSCRIWLVDEVHRLTGDSQGALLKTLEDTPSHVYFMLATTDPQKLLKTIITRCTPIQLVPLEPKDMEVVVAKVLQGEQKDMDKAVIQKLIEVADGSARMALVLLHQIIGLASAEEQIEAIQSSDTKRQAIDIARALLNPRVEWAKVAGILKDLEDEPETIRRIILRYSRTVLISGGPMAGRAYELICSFEAPFYDSGPAGLARACWEVSKKK